jgi:hypothetical protein
MRERVKGIFMLRLIVLATFVAVSSTAAAGDYTEVRDLKLDAAGLDTFIIDAGAGSLDVTGVDGLRHIEVRATIVVPEGQENHRQGYEAQPGAGWRGGKAGSRFRQQILGEWVEQSY